MKLFIRARIHLLIVCLAWAGLVLAEDRDYFQIIYDTSSPEISGLKPDFGYAVYLHADSKNILLDTGTNPDVLQHNMDLTGINVNELDMVVISHNHHDHAGGLESVRSINPSVPVYVPPNQSFSVDRLNVIEDSLEVTPNIFVIRGHTKVPTAGISDDLSIVIRSQSGPYVLSTCSHSGVEQIMDRATAVTGQPVYYFSGGSRLIHRPPDDTQKVVQMFEQKNVHVVSPSHCSLSHRVDKTFREILGQRVENSNLGKKIQIELPN